MKHYLIIDASTVAKLSGRREPVTLLSETGEFVGYFSPHTVGGSQPYIPEYSEEELERWENEPGERTLAEIMNDLRKLP